MSFDEVRSSVSESAVLELLVGAGLDETAALSLISPQPEQSSAQLGERRQPLQLQLSAEQSSGTLTPADRRSSAGGEDYASGAGSAFERSIIQMMQRMSQRLDDLTARVDESSGDSTETQPKSSSSASETQTPGSTPRASGSGRCWADVPVDEVPDYSAPLVWEDDVEEATQPLRQVSENTAKALKTAFSRPLANQARLQARKPYSFPNVEATKCPKLDSAAKQLLSKEQKQSDGALAKLQTLVLDAVAPLVHLVEEAGRGSLSGEQAAEIAKSALTLLGNASASISKERRRRVITSLNKKVHPLADEEDIFEEAPPLLLGKAFEEKMKAHLESLKCLAAPEQKQDFRRGRSYPPRGNGQKRRGGHGYNGSGGQRRFHPYNSNGNGRGKENFQRNKKTQ